MRLRRERLALGIGALGVVGLLAATSCSSSDDEPTEATGGTSGVGGGDEGGSSSDAGSGSGAEAGSGTGGDAGSSAGGDAGSSAGGDAGSSAGGDAGSSAGGDAGSSAGGDAGSSAGGDAGSSAGGEGGGVATGAFSLTYAGTVLASGDGFNFPMNADVKQGNEVAIFSEQKDGFSINNEGTLPLEIVSATITPDDGTMAEEFEVCSYTSAVNECIPYELPTIDPGERSDVYLQFYPIASGDRGGTLEIEYTYDGETFTHTLDLGGWGRLGDDSNPAYLFSGGTETFHKLWGGFASGQDEAPGALVSDPSGNVYAIGVTDGLDPNRDIYIVQIDADGALGWQKLYQSALRDDIRPTGDNGGLVPADAMVYDSGYLYIVGRSNYGASSVWAGVLMKIDASDGSLVWLRYWVPNTTRAGSTDDPNLMAVAVDGDTVYVTGETMDALNYSRTEQGIGLLAFDAATGDQRWAKLIVPQNYQAKHRGHSIRSLGGGVLYVAGLDYSGSPKGPFIARITGADATGDSLAVEWARTVTGEVAGSNFSSMDVDADGNAYMALEVTGASGKVKFVKATPDGTLTGVTLVGDGTNSWNNSFVVRVAGSAVYGGARVGISGWDTQKGDGLLAKLSADDLSVDWSAVYYTGTGANEICAHSVHGIAVSGTDLVAMGQVYTGNSNFYRYSGYWYDDPTGAVDWTPPVNDSTATTVMLDLPGAGLLDPTATDFPIDGAIIDVPATLEIEYQDAVDKNETTHGAATDGDTFITKISLQ